MKVLNMCLIPVLLLTFLACDPLNPVDSDDNPTDTTSMHEDYPIEIIWKTPLHPDTLSHCGSMNPLLGEEKVFFSGRHCYGQSEVILGINNQTGSITWKFDNLSDIISSHHTDPLIQDNLFISCDWNLFNINIKTGTLNWTTTGKWPESNVSPRFYNLNEKVHIILDPKGGGPWDPVNDLVKLNLQTGNIQDTLLTLQERPENPAGIENVIYHKYKNGNDWILFKNRSKIADFYAYDLTGDSVVWVNYDFNDGQGVVLENPVVHEGKVIFSAGLSLKCYDLDNGNQLWEVDNSSYQVNLYQDKILCYSRGDISEPILKSFVHAYDVNTGNQIWKTEVTQEAAGSERFTVYNGKLYLSDGYIQCLNVSNGRKIWKYRPPDYIPGLADYHSFESGLAIDKETGYCYISDGVYALCLNLNEVE